MANTPKEITIHLDQDALKEQVEQAIKQATIEFAMKLREAAFTLDPEWLPNLAKYEWERGYAQAVKDGATL